MRVASTAAKTPTKIEISAPLMTLATMSRPRRSAPNGSVSARGGSVIWILAARSAHSLYFGASGSMSERSTGFASLAMTLAIGSVPVAWARGPTKDGGASGTPTSFCQSPASNPTAAARIMTRNPATTASEAMPTLSLVSRRQAVTQTPAERSEDAAWYASTTVVIAASLQHDPRIDHLVQDVGAQVDHHRQRRQVDGHRLDHRIVTAVHRQQRFATEPRNREERLDQERTEEDAGQLHRDVGQDRDHRIAQHVHEQRPVLGNALGTRRAHIVLVDLVEEEAAVQPRVRRQRDEGGQQHRQHC